MKKQCSRPSKGTPVLAEGNMNCRSQDGPTNKHKGHISGRDRERKAEQNLIQSEKRYRQIVETANDLIYVTNERGRFTFINPIGVEMTGYS